ncbi:DUF3899 domain-containing protein [Sediminibacillus halophilus]|uniref:DUF3899 domain-containing protein n=1 Tax=Sediminibacillus halophilus TaxID=482461 RepID=A0A1G9RX83_9BACI|nr:DUF3899 domain-containing protein [Sediminibacillus halophilus]SDM27782.1 protein of unknown function [Sediminibacillus halophilus]
MKGRSLLFFVSIAAWIGAKYLLSFRLLEWVNLTFCIGLLLLILAAVTVVLQTGFLTPFFKGFRLIASSLVRKSQAMERVDTYLADDCELQNFKQRTIQLIGQSSLATGAGSLLVSIVGLFFL